MAGKYKKTRLSFEKPTKTVKKSSPKKSAPSKHLTKTQLEERLHTGRVAVIGLLVLASFALLIDLSLIITGGWDDVIVSLLASAPLLAFLATGVALLVKRKYKRRRRDFTFSLVIAVLFSCVYLGVRLFLVVMGWINYFSTTLENEIVGVYDCAASDSDRELGIYDTRLQLELNHYRIESTKTDAYVSGSYGAKREDNKYYLSTIIKQNTQRDKSTGYGETSFVLEFEDSVNVRFSAPNSGIIRFCKRK